VTRPGRLPGRNTSTSTLVECGGQTRLICTGLRKLMVESGSLYLCNEPSESAGRGVGAGEMDELPHSIKG